MVHESASSGYRKHTDTYHRARPSYHPTLVQRFAERYGHGVVVDLGAGTGIFTRQILEAGVSVIAVEPVAAMRALLEAALPHVDVRAGTAEAMPLDPASVDTVVAAQAFHWFAAEEALDEAGRVICAGGHLVTVWNVRDDSVGWIREYDRILGRYERDTPRHATMAWRRAIEADDRFELVEDWRIDNPQNTTIEGVVDRALSTSFIAASPAREQAGVADELRRLLPAVPGKFAFPYRSEMQAWRRR